MAIIIEEEQSRAGLVNILMYAVFLLVIGSALYYIFFKKPTLIEVAVPESFESTEQLSKINLNPNEVVNDPQFKALKQYITSESQGTFGRPNPFLGF